MNATFPITGMHCSSCTLNVEEIALEIPGVTKATASLATNDVTIEHDGSVSDAQVHAAIVEAGYTPGS